MKITKATNNFQSTTNLNEIKKQFNKKANQYFARELRVDVSQEEDRLLVLNLSLVDLDDEAEKDLHDAIIEMAELGELVVKKVNVDLPIELYATYREINEYLERVIDVPTKWVGIDLDRY